MDKRQAGIALVATLDSKGEEVHYLVDRLTARGRRALVVDVGTAGTPTCAADVSRSEVMARAGLSGPGKDPAAALKAMGGGARAIIAERIASGEIGAVAGIGGGKGAGVFDAVTRDLPFGFPKLLVSSGRPALLAEIAGHSDTILMPTLVDLFGMNRFTCAILRNAADALAGLDWQPIPARSRKVVAITAFGVTTPAVRTTQERLKAAGLDCIVFPANGAGGRAMEALVAKGECDGVLDLTTTELADLLLEGTASAGVSRLTAAGAAGIPQAVAPGAVDMANFGPPDSLPSALRDRRLYRHTPMTTLVRTTPAETREIGRMTAERLKAATGPVRVFWPEDGVSDYDRAGQPFHDPEANRSWLEEFEAVSGGSVPVTRMPCHINDPAFAQACADWMIDQLETRE